MINEQRISKVLIIDDDPVSSDNLIQALKVYPDVQLEATAPNGAKGRRQIMRIRPDLLFLDVELPDAQGIRLLADMRDEITWDMKVVFYTAYDKYLLDALRESAFDFLLKPFTHSDLSVVMERYKKARLSGQQFSSFASNMLGLISGSDSFLVGTVTGFKMLRMEEIGFFEYIKDRRLWEVVLFDHSRLSLKRNTKAEDIVNYSQQFVQISQSIVINVGYMALIDGRNCVLYPPFDQYKDLVISRGFLKSMQERFCPL